MNKIRYSYTMEFYSAMKKNEGNYAACWKVNEPGDCHVKWK
jgi:hypothetical protein